ncbi:hypothetical protein MNBD_GAMMA07-156 [hydrothermal vent metagenome]|uniref:Uncharacterized protein n=1 Tax=hydrothermal vent metagenome TaxID=652676 RepID=A0A3B0WTK3_9ZZZZ
MPITSQDAVTQALANIRLESLELPVEILALIKQALKDNTVDTSYILDLIRG